MCHVPFRFRMFTAPFQAKLERRTENEWCASNRRCDYPGSYIQLTNLSGVGSIFILLYIHIYVSWVTIYSSIVHILVSWSQSICIHGMGQGFLLWAFYVLKLLHFIYVYICVPGFCAVLWSVNIQTTVLAWPIPLSHAPYVPQVLCSDVRDNCDCLI